MIFLQKNHPSTNFFTNSELAPFSYTKQSISRATVYYL
jgi:hypothetical protein